MGKAPCGAGRGEAGRWAHDDANLFQHALNAAAAWWLRNVKVERLSRDFHVSGDFRLRHTHLEQTGQPKPGVIIDHFLGACEQTRSTGFTITHANKNTKVLSCGHDNAMGGRRLASCRTSSAIQTCETQDSPPRLCMFTLRLQRRSGRVAPLGK